MHKFHYHVKQTWSTMSISCNQYIKYHKSVDLISHTNLMVTLFQRINKIILLNKFNKSNTVYWKRYSKQTHRNAGKTFNINSRLHFNGFNVLIYREFSSNIWSFSCFLIWKFHRLLKFKASNKMEASAYEPFETSFWSFFFGFRIHSITVVT